MEETAADGLRILLVSPDLMATSRIAALGREHGARVETLRELGEEPRECCCDVVLLDLQALTEDPAVLIARLRGVLGPSQAEPPRLVAYGPHVARQRLEDARAAGADEVLSRGELLGSFPALVRRWRG